MDKLFERLKAEVEEERVRIYIERFGALPGMKDLKERERIRRDFN